MLQVPPDTGRHGDMNMRLESVDPDSSVFHSKNIKRSPLDQVKSPGGFWGGLTIQPNWGSQNGLGCTFVTDMLSQHFSFPSSQEVAYSIKAHNVRKSNFYIYFILMFLCIVVTQINGI